MEIIYFSKHNKKPLAYGRVVGSEAVVILEAEMLYVKFKKKTHILCCE